MRLTVDQQAHRAADDNPLAGYRFLLDNGIARFMILVG